MGGILNQLASTAGYSAFNGVLDEIKKIVDIVVAAFYGLVGVSLILFCIYVGFQMARAEDEGKRKNAKAQMFYAIIGIIGVGMMLVLFLAVLPNAGPTVSVNDPKNLGPGFTNTFVAVNYLLDIAMKIVLALVGVFACYVAWQFVKAETEDKRKQAKTQLLWCFIAIVGVTLLNMVANIIFGLSK